MEPLSVLYYDTGGEEPKKEQKQRPKTRKLEMKLLYYISGVIFLLQDLWVKRDQRLDSTKRNTEILF